MKKFLLGLALFGIASSAFPAHWNVVEGRVRSKKIDAVQIRVASETESFLLVINDSRSGDNALYIPTTRGALEAHVGRFSFAESVRRVSGTTAIGVESGAFRYSVETGTVPVLWRLEGIDAGYLARFKVAGGKLIRSSGTGVMGLFGQQTVDAVNQKYEEYGTISFRYNRKLSEAMNAAADRESARQTLSEYVSKKTRQAAAMVSERIRVDFNAIGNP